MSFSLSRWIKRRRAREKLRRWPILFMVHVLLFVAEKHLSAALSYSSLKQKSKKCPPAEVRNSEKLIAAAPFLGIHFSAECLATLGRRMHCRGTCARTSRALMGSGNEKWVLPPAGRDRSRAAHTVSGNPRFSTMERNDRVCDLDWRDKGEKPERRTQRRDFRGARANKFTCETCFNFLRWRRMRINLQIAQSFADEKWEKFARKKKFFFFSLNCLQIYLTCAARRWLNFAISFIRILSNCFPLSFFHTIV